MFSSTLSLLESPLMSWTSLWLFFLACLYARGWLTLRKRGSAQWQGKHLLSFVGAISSLGIALLSPIDQLSNYLFSVHMLQHLLLMMVVPPLFWISKPLVPILTGLPSTIRRDWAGPILSSPTLRSALTFIQRPAIASFIFAMSIWIWHIPALFNMTFLFSRLHQVEHVTFLGASILFWKPIVQSTQAKSSTPPWWLIPYLLFADIQNTLLSALLTFSSRPLYSHYSDIPRLYRISPLQDQTAAGVLMWVPGSIVFLIPLAWVTLTVLFPTKSKPRPASPGGQRKAVANSLTPLPILNQPSQPSPAPRQYDMMRVPFVGTALRARISRPAVQWTVLIICCLVIVDGLVGPQFAPANLAGVIPWTYGRGFIVLGLLAVGNLSCYACPLTLPRRITEKWFPSPLEWPGFFQSKWIAVSLLFLFFWAYEVLDIWNSPWWTAWLITAYFLVSFAIDSWFGSATFCRHVCPIGQFQFIQSLVSPAEIRVKSHSVCQKCQTRDCLHGRDRLQGCQLGLNPPLKSGNMNCTFCLDCVHACPNDNIGWLATSPLPVLMGGNLTKPKVSPHDRIDIAVLASALVWLAFFNSFSMTEFSLQWRHELISQWEHPLIGGTIAYLLFVIVFPAAAFFLASLMTPPNDETRSIQQRFSRYSLGLVPLGASMWIAHFLFHLSMAGSSATFAFSRFLSQMTGYSIPYFSSDLVCHQPSVGWLLRSEILLLDVGLLASLYVLYRIASEQPASVGRNIMRLLPWGIFSAALFVIGIWTVLQPMQMRNALAMGG